MAIMGSDLRSGISPGCDVPDVTSVSVLNKEYGEKERDRVGTDGGEGLLIWPLL